MAEPMKTPWYSVNRELLAVKVIYFTFLAAVGDLLPFIPVYMKQLGLSSTETGIIYGVMPFIAFFVRPLFGAVADKLRRHKLVLMICTFLTGVLYCLLLVTPTKTSTTDIENKMMIRTQIQCNPIDSYVVDCEKVKNESGVIVLQNCDQSLRAFAKQLTDNSSQVNCTMSCGLGIGTMNLYACFTQDVTPSNDETCVDRWNDTGEGANFEFSVNDLFEIIRNEVGKPGVVYNGQTCGNYDLKNIFYNGRNFWQFTCNSEAVFDCKVTCSEDLHKKCLTVTNNKLSKTFWIFFVIFLFCNIFFSPVLSLVDAIAYDILGDKRGRWGKQRLWGSIGFALFAITSTYIMDALSKSNKTVNYTVSFYIFLALTTISTFVTYFIKCSESIHCRQMFQHITSLIKYPKIIVFLLVITVFGVFNGVIEAFLFWYLQDLGSTQIILGLCLVFSCTPEIVMLLFAGKIIKKLGHVPCLYLALGAYSLRFFCYSFLTNAWYVLPIELLHSLTFALMYAAASSYASIITPEGMSATVQGLVGGLHFGFGKGIGSLITGKLFDPVSGLGEVWTFRFYGFFALFVLVVYASVQCLCFREPTEAVPKSTAGNHVTDEDEEMGKAEDQLLGTNTVNNENAEL
ncbi:major facilitator superfamily domain-containing protein 6-like [Mercenaria mercenaria]|uniref:major facilitator superfamily domain-containing protein 6-like n=1 Tax=Mercenaria mercenaria TaxID=6596 RepID=UPI00234E936F|nr:major facilitator superfamily domain-containing protein 6-like [Mercenaria mercenaria]XP_045204653.2 major facilitator superfamily domain-containing protein 6-like [Mercenaria mercenaria]